MAETASTPQRRKAYRSELSGEILNILKRTADEYEANGDPESDLRDAPEYLLNIDVARGLVKEFGALRYRLEHHADWYAESAINDVDVRQALGKDRARFDIVLLNRHNNVPRYIIEMKRGTRIISDARRILRIATLDHGRRRWRHGFLVTILRRSDDEAARIATELKQEIESLGTEFQKLLPPGGWIRVKNATRKIGKSRTVSDERAIHAAVFQVSLMLGDDEDGSDEPNQELRVQTPVALD